MLLKKFFNIVGGRVALFIMILMELQGGMSILWNPAMVLLENFFSTAWTLSARYRAIGSSKEGILTNAYGPQTNIEKDSFLKILSDIGNLVGNQKWILGGDLNIILNLEEKKGGIRRLDKDSENIQRMIENLHLIDIETWNGTFTWKNRCSGCSTGSLSA
jgi:hypothetical protein